MWGYSLQKFGNEKLWAREICAHVSRNNAICTSELPPGRKEGEGCFIHTKRKTKDHSLEINNYKRNGPDGIIIFQNNKWFLTRKQCQICNKISLGQTSLCKSHKYTKKSKVIKIRPIKRSHSEIISVIDESSESNIQEIDIPDFPDISSDDENSQPLKKRDYTESRIEATIERAIDRTVESAVERVVERVIEKQLKPLYEYFDEMYKMIDGAFAPYNLESGQSGYLTYSIFRHHKTYGQDMDYLTRKLRTIEESILKNNKDVRDFRPEFNRRKYY